MFAAVHCSLETHCASELSRLIALRQLLWDVVAHSVALATCCCQLSSVQTLQPVASRLPSCHLTALLGVTTRIKKNKKGILSLINFLTCPSLPPSGYDENRSSQLAQIFPHPNDTFTETMSARLLFPDFRKALWEIEELRQGGSSINPN